LIRDLSSLAGREFDLVVVGGGIYGLTIAYDAAQRGLSVALVERSDFGGATSFNHLKTIHGGLRYLQSGDLIRMRQSIRERRTFARIAPRFVAPLPFVIPTSRSLTRNRVSLRSALALDTLVGFDRNHRLRGSHRLPAGQIVDDRQCGDLFDGAVPNVASGAMWHDYVTSHGDRLTLAFGIAAAELGATLANYTEALGLLRTRAQRLSGIRAKDVLAGEQFDIRARTVVNAAGPWASRFLTQSGMQTRWPLLKAMNLVTSRPARKAAVVGSSRSGRALVLLPWQGRTLIGTSESRDARSPDDQQARSTEVMEFLADVNATFPLLELEPEEISLVHRGIVPAAIRRGTPTLLGHSRIIDHTSDGATELVSVVGVKYTTARAVAERTVDLIMQKLGRSNVPCRTAETILPGAAVDDKDPADPVGHAIRAEMAQTLTDVIVRRTGIGAAGHPGDALAEEYAVRMRKALGWSEDRKNQELSQLRKFYDVI
jgi:glycerol-3-phosphate dehydrogenase